MRPPIHAPDGGIVGHALCENPRGDVTDYERDVDCPDCLDALDGADFTLRQRMRKHGFQFLEPPSMPDRHREKPLSLRLGAERQRLEDYARSTGQPVRRVIANAVKAWLDKHAGQSDRNMAP